MKAVGRGVPVAAGPLARYEAAFRAYLSRSPSRSQGSSKSPDWWGRHAETSLRTAVLYPAIRFAFSGRPVSHR